MDLDKLDKSPTYIMIFIATVVIEDQGFCLAQDYHSWHHCHTERLLSGSWLPRLPLPMETDSCLVHDYHGSDCHWKQTLVWPMITMATIVIGNRLLFGSSYHGYHCHWGHRDFFLAHDTSNHGYYYHWRHRHLADLWLLSYHVNGETNSSEQSLALIVCIDILMTT